MQPTVVTKEPTGGDPHPAPILFVHGSWHGKWCWEEHFLSYFAECGYTAHALDLRGHGESTGREHLRWNRVWDYVADVERVASQMPAPPIMVGHSMGGLVVQKYLEIFEASLMAAPAAVLLASVPVGGVWRLTLHLSIKYPLPFLQVMTTLRLYPIIGTQKRAHELLFSRDRDPNAVEQYFRRLQDESFLSFVDQLMGNLPRADKVKTTPVLVMGAEDDAIFLPAEVEATAAAYHTRPVMFGGMAHDMMLEADWQQVADHILKWLGEHSL